jgi:FkbM family methyltransferase
MDVAKILEEVKQNTKFQGGASFEDFQAKIFIDELSNISTQNPTMIEVGSNDCFYSILFNRFFKEDKKPLNICVEVSDKLIELGRANVLANDCSDFRFKHARMGKLDEPYFDMIRRSSPDLWGNLSTETITIKNLIDEFKLKEISMLHMDVQGSEISILEELIDLDIVVENIFVSTHKNSLFGSTHDKCIDIFKTLNLEIVFSDEHQGGYGDGLIIAKTKPNE